MADFSKYYKGNYYLNEKETRHNFQIIADFFTENNWTKNAILGMLGNMYFESGGNSGIWQNLKKGRTDLGYGITQWTPATKLFNWLDKKGYSHDDLKGQCERILYEVENNEQWIHRDGYTLSFKEYVKMEDTPENMAQIFLSCYEGAPTRPRPKRSTKAKELESIIKFDGTSTKINISDDNAKKVESAVRWAMEIASDESHGYDQANRWGPDFDCSSFVISAFQQAGIKVKDAGATSTRNIRSVFKKCGFTEVSLEANKLKRGDVILKEGEHVVLHIGNGKIVHASINELGTTTGGQTGDQTGKEICVRKYYVPKNGWSCALRFPHGKLNDDGTESTEDDEQDIDYDLDEGSGEIYEKLTKTSFNMKSLDKEQIHLLKKLDIDDYVQMLFTFNRRKKEVGINFFGNRLTFDDKVYKIIDVRTDGLLVLKYKNSKLYKYVNPNYIIQKGDELYRYDD